MHFAAQSHRTNNIMRTLTVLTAIFLPLNLITGFFGMNFDALPLIHSATGIWMAVGTMAAVGIGLMAGMPLSDIIGSVNEGIGNTLKGIALLVGLGSMFGAILEESGGAQTLAVTMVRKFGDEKAAWALGITGLVVAMPVFFDAGLIILIPLAFSLAKRTKRSVLYYVIPLLAGLAVMGLVAGIRRRAR